MLEASMVMTKNIGWWRMGGNMEGGTACQKTSTYPHIELYKRLTCTFFLQVNRRTGEDSPRILLHLRLTCSSSWYNNDHLKSTTAWLVNSRSATGRERVKTTPLHPKNSTSYSTHDLPMLGDVVRVGLGKLPFFCYLSGLVFVSGRSYRRKQQTTFPWLQHFTSLLK